MSDIADLPPQDRSSRAEQELAISQFANTWLGGANTDLFQELLVTLIRLARDGASRGDLKLIQRSLAELRYGFKIFAPYREVRKISIFGSSRTPEGHPDYLAAVDFSRLIEEFNWMVITGAGDGIMKAGHGGAGKEASFGVAIRLPFEQKTNDIIARDPKLVNFRYFFTRKVMFLKEASAVALFPGGFGTQDEGFEALTLVQTGKSALIPIVMCEQQGGTYWPRWKEYVAEELLRTGMISEQDMHLFAVTDNVQTAVDEVVRFYSNYHSSRYVGDELVLRLQRAPSSELLQRLNDEFARRILKVGSIEATPTLASENGEYPDLPRIKLAFDRKSHGFLRQMINIINEH